MVISAFNHKQAQKLMCLSLRGSVRTDLCRTFKEQARSPGEVSVFAGTDHKIHRMFQLRHLDGGRRLIYQRLTHHHISNEVRRTSAAGGERDLREEEKQAESALSQSGGFKKKKSDGIFENTVVHILTFSEMEQK